MNSHIYYNKELNRWTLQSLRHPELNATMENAEVLPMGTHMWEPDMCDPDVKSPKELTLSRCFPNMYTCNDGTCIPLR